MTRLDCNVTNCLHNAENCCCKAAIIVEGEQAKDTCDTVSYTHLTLPTTPYV